MLIDHVTLRLVRIPLLRSFRTSFGSLPDKTAVIVELRTADGLRGFGESSAFTSATYTEESVYSVFAASLHDLAPRVLGREFQSAEEFLAILGPVRGNRFAKAGFETAVWDLISQRRNEPLWVSLGGVRSTIEVGDSLSLYDSIDELLGCVDERVEQGYRRIKLKIEPGWDLEPVRRVRERYPDIPLSVDANAAYRLSDARIFRQMDELELLMIEQPLEFDDLVEHSRLQARIQTPLCLDESVRSAATTLRAMQLDSCRIVNIKTGRVGGLVEARRIHDICQVHGVPVWMGGLFETGIGRAFNLALASLENFTLAADMSPALMYFESDLVEDSFELHDGLVAVPAGVGTGFTVSESKLAHYTVEDVVLGLGDG
jgi:O-succinylbenzoate synthase